MWFRTQISIQHQDTLAQTFLPFPQFLNKNWDNTSKEPTAAPFSTLSSTLEVTYPMKLTQQLKISEEKSIKVYGRISCVWNTDCGHVTMFKCVYIRVISFYVVFYMTMSAMNREIALKLVPSYLSIQSLLPLEGAIPREPSGRQDS